jgi:hypothetical protein
VTWHAAADAAALRALAAEWPGGAAFDLSSIGGRAAASPRLRLGLAFLRPRLVASWRLDRGSRQRIGSWLGEIAGREVGGLRLERDRIGWCRIEGWR